MKIVWRAVLIVAAGGCGRYSFEAHDAARIGDGGHEVEVDSAFAPTTDAPPASVTAILGACTSANTPGAMFDTSLDNTVPTENCGARREMRVGDMGGRVSLIRFDLAAIPATATVFSASLNIWVADDALEAGYVNIYPLIQSWVEGTGDFDPGVSNWTQAAAGTAWATVGAASPGARTDQVIGTFTARTIGGNYVVPLDPSVVQGWVSSPATNFGMELASLMDGNQGGWLWTQEGPDPATRPCFDITYVP